MTHLQWNNPHTIEEIKAILSTGSVILSSTDTVLGLLATISENGKLRIDHIKKRIDKPYLMVVRDKKIALDMIAISQHKYIQIEKLLNLCWPGPVTIIFPAKSDLPQWMVSPSGNIALRVPLHKGLQNLLHYFPVLFSTSANITGMPIPHNIAEVDPEIIKNVELIVTNDDEGTRNIVPSTILDCTEMTVKIVRQGAANIALLAQKSGLSFV